MDRARILDELGNGVIAVDEAYRTIYANPAAERMLGPGARAPDRVAWTLAQAWLPDGSARYPPDEMPLARALRGESCDDVDVLVRREDGAEFFVTATACPVREGGQIVGAVAVFRDVTAQRRSEAARKRTAALAQMVRAVGTAANEAETVPAALDAALRLACRATGFAVAHAWTWDAEARRLRSSGVWYLDDPGRRAPIRRASERLSVLPDVSPPIRAALSGTSVWVRDVDTEVGFARKEAAAAAGLRSLLAVPVLAGGATAGVLELFSVAELEPDNVMVEAVAQVGAQVGRCYERARALANERFVQDVVDHVADPIFVKDRDFRFVFLSRALCELVGHAPEDMIGRTDEAFFPRDQADFFREKDAEVFASGGRVVIDEEPITDSHGRLHWLSTTKVPLRDSRGNVTHLVGVIHDITRMKEAEELLSQKNAALAKQVTDTTKALADLDLANRELETFAYTVSHDLRAPLRAVLGYSAILLNELAEPLGPDGQALLRRIEASARRMAQLIDDLLALSRVSRAELARQPVDLSVLARGVVEELRHDDPARNVDVSIEDGLVVEGDPNLLRIAVENLLANAWKFTDGRDPAHITVGRSGGEIYVRDDGAGFDMAYSGRLFKPFSRLHGPQEYAGTGIGLATVERIVRRHGGTVRAEGEVGKGATVYVRLPGVDR